MQIQQIKHIAIIGSGNTAWVLAKLLFQHHLIINTIISKNTETGNGLAIEVNAKFKTQLEFEPTTQLILICTTDSEIEKIAFQIKNTNALVCHCAGSISIDVLQNLKKYGVFYPLQSLSKTISKENIEIPFLIEANTTENELLLKDLCHQIHQNSQIATSEARLQYHLAAVFANNFSNAMYTAAYNLLENKNLDFKLLLPLILQTVEKLKYQTPHKNQTGPALRGDEITMEKHLELLKNETLLTEIYKIISEFIQLQIKH